MESPQNPDALQHGMVGKIADYIEHSRGKSSSALARDAALMCIFDLLGAAAVGIGDIGPRAIRDVIPAIYGDGTNPVWFTGKGSSLIGAAWANSAAAAALDLDDGNRFARGHLGAAIIPVAFAVAHETGATLEDVITAIVIGYEVGISVGAAKTSYGSSGTWTPYGVVATAAALRGTPRGVIEHALAIAGESAPSQAFASAPIPRIPAPEGSAVKEGIPWSVVTGLTALYLAEAGHTGPRNILESQRHYQFPADQVLGEIPHICATYFKPYACCRHIHAPLIALERLLAEHDIVPGGIDGIDVEIHSAGLRISNRPAPENIVDIQYSIPYCLALVSLYGRESLLPLTADALGRADVLALAGKVTLSLSPALDAVYPQDILACVTIRVGDQHFSSGPTAPEGEPLMSWDALEEKFKTATRFVATPSRIEEMLGAIRSLRSGDAAPLEHVLANLRLV